MMVLMISRKRSDVKNDVRFDLVLVENSRVHRIVGHKDIHLYDIIKSLYLANTYDIRYKNQIVAKLDLELCFAYGIFGFGFSHQLENRQKKVSDIVSHSLFFRVEPPDHRKQVKSNVITPMPVRHPEIINFTEKANIGGFDLENESNLPDINMFDDVEIVGESSLLHRILRRRMNRLQSNFSQLRGRQQRKNFLEKLVLSHIDDHQTVEGQGTIPDKTLVGGQRGGATSPGDIVQAPQNLSSSEEEDESVDTLAPMLILAPGLTSRGRGLAELPTVSEDEGSISSDSASNSKRTDATTSKVPQDNQLEAPYQTTTTSTTLARGIARLIGLRPWRRSATDNNS
ncbi:C2 calcium-dependent domain-containing protein 6-like isoform X2 [Anneissia japonica]|uniref:C2 calcium-dependent domain-containing protein 6-like isoform X2 n=1 Tax=Anneissia japonica TaxID=1529436 RepID=UPI0014256E57|nr:C2 calcium-dependent domain-containing protein 6-like isoform X2 [Anneissia japonica]